ncbi:MAG: sulfatase-like hydrolase/transferase, partial [Candidatus Aminicenantes bacterium]|nr:sulfatase-like hydrolase/transferase [Candidatus Aminicenantes bacterium]
MESERPQKIFAGTLRPAEKEEHRHVNYEKIDISVYAGKKVGIHFITRLPDSQSHRSAGPAPLSFWHNPVVFSKTTAAEIQGGNKFNVIFISLDTLRWDRLGCYGYERETSPHIDALAEDCVQFSYCFAQSNWTLPSHVSMLTSLNGRRHQVYLAHEKMSPSLITIADILRVHGFYNG